MTENTTENGTNQKLKITVIILAVVAALLIIVFVFVWLDRQSMIKDLVVDKEELTQELVTMQSEYSILSSNNDSLSSELDKEKMKVDQLLERIKKTDASNRSMIRKYEKELGTLRSIMKHYIIQIDSLNTLNVQLKKDAAIARAEAKKSNAKFEELSKTTDEYAKLVEKGSTIKGRSVSVVAINASNKETERSSRVEKLKTCLYLIENNIAPKGPTTLYLRVKGPDGILMTNDSQRIFNMAGDQMIYTESREVDYQGSEIEVCIYFKSAQGFTKGVYTVEVYSTGGLLGEGDILLK